MKYLGIDYGKKKIGLAVSEGEMVEPFMIFQVSGLKDALGKVLGVVKDEKIDEVVIGVPESGESRKITKNFIAHFKKNIKAVKDIKLIEVEETLSSKRAQEMMVGLGIAKSKREDEDSYAAAYILQGYLDSIDLS